MIDDEIEEETLDEITPKQKSASYVSNSDIPWQQEREMLKIQIKRLKEDLKAAKD